MKGIINRVSIESGPIYYGFMQPPDRSVYEARGVEFLERIGCKSIAELRQRDAWELFDEYAKWSPGMMGGFSFCVDGRFLPKPYAELMEAGDFNDFDVLIGSCAQEFPAADPEKFTLAEYERYLAENFPDYVWQGQWDYGLYGQNKTSAPKAAREEAAPKEDLGEGYIPSPTARTPLKARRAKGETK